MPTGYTTVSGAALTDSTGIPITNATISFQPCNNQGVPVSYCVNGAGQATDLPVTSQVAAGAFTVQLADTLLTQPANIAYLVSVTDNLSGKQLLGPGYLIQPHGTTWSFDTFVPNLGALAIIQAGPTGPPGPTGASGYSGLSIASSAASTYNAATTDDVVVYSGTGSVFATNSSDAVGRVRMVVNVGPAPILVNYGGPVLAIEPGDSVEFYKTASGWVPSNNQVGVQISTGTATLSLENTAAVYTGPAGGVLTLPALGILGFSTLTIHNYSMNPVAVNNSSGSLYATLGSKQSITVLSTGGSQWATIATTATPSPQSGLSVVTTTAGANYIAAATDDVILTSLAVPNYVTVNASGDAAGRKRTVINVGTATATLYISGAGATYTIEPGQAASFLFTGANWVPDRNLSFAAQVNSPTYQMNDQQTFIYCGCPVGATITYPVNASPLHPFITIYNYGANPVALYNGSTFDRTLQPGNAVTLCSIGTGSWFLVSSSVVSSGAGSSTVASGQFPSSQIFQMGPTVIPGYTAWGDSITVSTGATIPANGYAAILGRAFGAPYVNYGQGGDQATDLSLKVHSLLNPLPTNNPVATVFIGHNDIAFASGSGAIANTLLRFQSSLLASLSFLALPNSSKVFGQASTLYGGSATLSGTFAANTTLAGNLGKMAAKGTANGDSVTLQLTTTTPNQAVYVCWYGADGDGGSATVTIDGNAAGVLQTAGPGGTIATVNGNTTAVFGARYTVPAAGVHTIVLTINSATAAGNSFTFLWAGTQPVHVPQPGEPRVFVLDPVYEAGFANRSISDQYIAALGTLLPQLVGDGLLLQHLVTNNYVINALGMSTTALTAPDGTAVPASTTPGLHPNDYGHAEIANMVLVYAQPTAAAASAALTFPYTNLTGTSVQLHNGTDQIAFVNGTTVTVPPLQINGEAHFVYNYGASTVNVVGLHSGTPSTTLAPNTGMLIVCNGAWWRIF